MIRLVLQSLLALGLGLSLGLGLAGCGQGSAPTEANSLTIAAAASLKDLLTAAGESFEATHPGAEIALSFEASSTLSRQIEEGAAYDALLSADAANIDRISGKLDMASRRVFLSNRLVMVGREGLADAPTTPEALAAGTWTIAMAGPAVPVGKYARSVLERKGLLKAVVPRFATADNVRAALALVESGAADVGFVYLTDAKVAQRAKLLWTAAPGDEPASAYVAAATSGASPLAHAYVEWLASPEFLKQAESFGFLTPASP